MIGTAKLAAAMLGTSTIANGFAVTPTGPASLQVVVAPGEIYSLTSIDALAFSTLPADTTHSILKQGIMLDGITLSCPAPTTTGQSIAYLVQATYQDVDSNPVLLPYYNSANPALPYSGMGNNGITQNTVRKGAAVLQVKAGASATTGSQVTPSPDSGYIGLYVVTVAFGQTTIVSGNIAQYSGAPLLPSGILQSIQNGTTSYALDVGTANAYSAYFSPAITVLQDGLTLRFKALNANSGASTFSPNGLAPAAIVGGGHSALQGGEIIANSEVWLQWNSSIGGGSWVLVSVTGGGTPVAAATQSRHAVQKAQLGSFSSFVALSSSTTLTAGYLGQAVFVLSAGTTQTLPQISVSPAGSAIVFAAFGSTTISGSGAELITNTLNTASTNTITINAGDQIQLTSNGLKWYISSYSPNIGAQTQSQAYTAFTTGGTSPALTLTPSPAMVTYATPNQRYRVKFSAASTGADTLNVSGNGARNIKQYDATGAKVAAVFAVNQLADVEYDGTDFVVLDQLPTIFQATTTLIGGAKIGTQSQINTGTDNTTIVTPLTMTTKYARYLSLGQAITTGGGLTLAHNLGGVVPSELFGYLSCTSADAGYSVGDKPGFTIGGSGAGGGSAVSVWPDATNLNVRFGNSTFSIPHKTTGAQTVIDTTKWQFVFGARV